MKPDKLDSLFREKLNARRLEPSDQAWTRLESQLEAARPAKRRFAWYVAAGIAVLLAVGGIWHRIKTPVATMPSVVNAAPARVEQQTSPLVVKPEVKQQLAGVTKKSPPKKTVVAGISPEQQQIIVAESPRISTDSAATPAVLALQEPSRRVRRPIRVDPSMLLREVDRELNQTYREKVLSRLNTNYQEIKIAITNRNLEN